MRTYSILLWVDESGSEVERVTLAGDEACMAYLATLGSGYTAEEVLGENRRIVTP